MRAARRLPMCPVHAAWADIVEASSGTARAARDLRDARTVASRCPECSAALPSQGRPG